MNPVLSEDKTRLSVSSMIYQAVVTDSLVGSLTKLDPSIQWYVPILKGSGWYELIQGNSQRWNNVKAYILNLTSNEVYNLVWTNTYTGWQCYFWNTLKASPLRSNSSFKIILSGGTASAILRCIIKNKQTHSRKYEPIGSFKSSASLQAPRRTDPSPFSQMRKTLHWI